MQYFRKAHLSTGLLVLVSLRAPSSRLDDFHVASHHSAIASAKGTGAPMEQMSSVVSDVAKEPAAEEIPLAPETFSFIWLESCLDQYAHVDDEPAATKLERYAFTGAFFFGALGVVSVLLFRNQFGLRALQVGLSLELLCLAVALLVACRRAWRFFQHQHKDFAENLDKQLVQYNVIVDALRRYPPSVIDTHLRYVRDRKSRLTYRAGLISGGFEKFGILPLLAAMYLQFKDWSFSDWKTLTGHVHVLGTVLLWALMIFYAVSWWAVRTKSHLDLYETVLAEASVREKEG